jgi:hydrogenase maturation protein HypF
MADAELDLWRRQVEAGVNAPWSHAAGRVFDSVAAALGAAAGGATYDGRPAIRLEALAREAARGAAEPMPFGVAERDGLLTIDWSPFFARLAERETADPTAVARGFHEAVSAAALRMAEYGADRSGLRRVALSGGCFMNRLLNELLTPALEAHGFTVLRHREVPPNDGGIALGQAVIAGRADALPSV